MLHGAKRMQPVHTTLTVPRTVASGRPIIKVKNQLVHRPKKVIDIASYNRPNLSVSVMPQ